MSYILLIFYFVLLLYFIYNNEFYTSILFPKYIPLVLFTLKFIAGVGVYIIYSKFYGDRSSSDMFNYFDDGNIIYSSIYINPLDYLRMVLGIGADSSHLDVYYNTCNFWIKDFNYGLINDNRIVIRFNAIVRLFSLGNFHIHTLFMSFISFTGLWGIFKIFEKEIPLLNEVRQKMLHRNQLFNIYKYNSRNISLNKWFLIFVVFFFPSVYFWTSALLKEGILMFAFGIFLYKFSVLLQTEVSFKNVIWLFVMAFILLFSKFYVLLASVPGILFIVLIKKTGDKYFVLKLLSVILLFLILLIILKYTGFNIWDILANKQHDFINYVNSSGSVGSKIDIPLLKPTFISVIKNSPSAMFRTLFRPSVFDVNNIMSLMAALENLLIIGFILLTIMFFNKQNLKNMWLWFSVIFVVVLFVLSGLTTPVLGALVRYKAPALPFLGLIFIYMFDFGKFNSFIFFKKDKL